MDFWAAVTDNGWFSYLAAIGRDGVAFGHPSGPAFHAVPEGAPFLFKLKSPHNHIAGGGNFVINSKKITSR